MTLVNLHPEDLIEREMRGDLSPAERDVLESHARQCAACRLERKARTDFLAEAERPEAEADVQRLLAAAWPLAVQKVAQRPKRPAMRHARFVLVAAAVITVTGLAAASRWTGARFAVPWAMPSNSLVAPAANAAAPAPKHHASPAAPAPAAPDPVDVTPSSVDPVSPTEVGQAAAAPAPLAARAPHEVGAATRRAAEAAPAEPSDAPTLFQRANEAREMGDHSGAGELYGKLLNRFRASPEAHVSLAMFGRMLLDDGNAGGALRCFDDYLRQGGALREDVMVGRAVALQRLGRVGEEANAWSSLLEAYPGSVHAERARRRLLELGRG
jgi:hypothetical protein